MHARPIRGTDLDASDFRCRYLVLNDAHITLAESVLITTLRPAWNGMGFGSNVVGGPELRGRVHSGTLCIPAGADGRPHQEVAVEKPPIASLHP